MSLTDLPVRWIADLLYPQHCVGCGILARGGLCRGCIDDSPRPGPFVCDFCGNGLTAPSSNCPECRGRQFAFDRARQAADFSGALRDAIHRYKYQAVTSMAGPLAIVAAEAAAGLEKPPGTVVTWAPPAEERIIKRGFDHGAALAEQAARRTGLKAAPLLRRVRKTAPQMGLEPQVRRTNLKGAFYCEDAPGSVLVVDDVFTTGATADEAARALREAGAFLVQVACVARTLPAARHRSYNGSGFPSGSVVAGIDRRFS